MHKKLMLACMAIAAFAAFVIAPAAQAATLTEGTSALATGTSVEGINEGKTKFTGAFNVECEEAHLKGTVKKNSGGEVEGEIPVGGAVFNNVGSTECSSALGKTAVTVTSKLCLKIAIGSDTVTVTGCGANVVFDLKVGSINCKYSTASVSGTATTNTTPAKVTVSEQPASLIAEEPKNELFPFCPSSGKLDMTFKLFTTGGATGLTLS